MRPSALKPVLSLSPRSHLVIFLLGSRVPSDSALLSAARSSGHLLEGLGEDRVQVFPSPPHLHPSPGLLLLG